MSASLGKTNPMLVVAAISVMLFSGVGIAVMTGVIPDSFSKNAPADAMKLSDSKTDAQPISPAMISANTVDTAAAEKPITGMASEPRAVAAAPHKKPQPVAHNKPSQKSTSEKIAMNDNAQEPAHVCANCGVVSSIDVIQEKGEGSGLGAVAGAVGGGLLGNQIGGGTGKKIATVAGVLGGGFAGHEIEKQVKKTTRYDVLVKMETGGYRTFSEPTDPGLVAGEKIRVHGDRLVKE